MTRTSTTLQVSTGSSRRTAKRWSSSYEGRIRRRSGLSRRLDAGIRLVFGGSAYLFEYLNQSAALGQQRQSHGGQVVAQDELLADLSASLTAFYNATVELGVASSVTTFTASDFGRTFPSNGGGSDHGWGNHQMIVGGSVHGGDLYGTVPTLVEDGPDDSGQGRWIPTTSVDEYAATLARWFGVASSDMSLVLPNLGRFASTDLGFMG